MAGRRRRRRRSRGGDGRWRLKWLDEHQYNASVLLLRGLLIFSMFFRIMSCNVTFRRRKEDGMIVWKYFQEHVGVKESFKVI